MQTAIWALYSMKHRSSRRRGINLRRSIQMLLVGGIAFTLLGCQGEKSDSKPRLPEVGVQKIVPHTIHLTDEFNGRVEAIDTVELRPRVSGYLQQVTYKEGDLVPKGAVLFVIDKRPYIIALEKAEAQLQRARAATQLSTTQLRRAQALITSHAISQEELDKTRASDAQANADFHAAEAAVDDARLNLSFTEVRSPISGRVSRAQITIGNLARADETLLTTIVSQDPVYVYFDCDEQSYLRYLAERSSANDRALNGGPARVGLANETGFPHAGSVDFLDNRLDPATGTIRARVRLENPRGLFTSGLYARVQLTSGTERKSLLVDDRSVLTDQDRKYVYVIGPDNKALRRDVTIGRQVGDERIVEKGLASGDLVIVDGMQRIFYPGAVVKPKMVAADAANSPEAGAHAPATAQ